MQVEYDFALYILLYSVAFWFLKKNIVKTQLYRVSIVYCQLVNVRPFQTCLITGITVCKWVSKFVTVVLLYFSFGRVQINWWNQWKMKRFTLLLVLASVDYGQQTPKFVESLGVNNQHVTISLCICCLFVVYVCNIVELYMLYDIASSLFVIIILLKMFSSLEHFSYTRLCVFCNSL